MGYTHGHEWTLQDIENRILEVADFLGVERMPSRSEIENYYGNSALSNKIAKTGGCYKWADKLGLEVKESESRLGIDIELRVKKALEEQGFKCETTSIKHPYDLLVNGCVKIDVKAARRTKIRGSYAYSFRLAKAQQTCDIYVAVKLNSKKEILKTYIIPAHVISKKKQLAIGACSSKYDCYIDRWDIIEKMSAAFTNIS